ncbi:hypothetical protein ACFVDH_20935 [Streptomyces sp. NPDC057674]|uniref:hypothetical protein n=1 Tax=Streptomyces sp. NPDC057674 TaxID=3346203 RepID=UPI0036848BCB
MRVEVVPDDATYLLSEREVTALRAPGLEALAPLLDGTRDLAALQRELTAALTADEVATLVAALRRAGLVDDRPARAAGADPPGPPPPPPAAPRPHPSRRPTGTWPE